MSSEILNNIRQGVCAIGYLKKHFKESLNPSHDPWFEIVGTGFFVRSYTVITNRHVISDMAKIQKEKKIPDDQRVLQIVLPSLNNHGSWSQTYIKFESTSVSNNPNLDIGFISIPIVDDPDLNQFKPLCLAKSLDFEVGESIGVCGYPYGMRMMERKGRVYRFGPVLQQGYISAIAPYDVSQKVEEILLDVRTVEGMSGSPVFRIKDGVVIGIHHEGWNSVTQLAIPLHEEKIKPWLEFHDKIKK